MMLRMGSGAQNHYGSWEVESYGDEDEIYDDDYDDVSEEDYDGSNADGDDEVEDVFDVHARVESDNQSRELDPSSFPDDEAYARALQDAEEHEMAARLLALSGINES